MLNATAAAIFITSTIYALAVMYARRRRARAGDALRSVMEETKALEALRRATSRVVVSSRTYHQLVDRFPAEDHLGISVFVAEQVGPDEVAYIVPAYEATLFDQDEPGQPSAPAQ